MFLLTLPQTLQLFKYFLLQHYLRLVLVLFSGLGNYRLQIINDLSSENGGCTKDVILQILSWGPESETNPESRS